MIMTMHILTKGYVPNRYIEEIVLEICSLKPTDLDVCIRIELFCDPAGDTIKLNTVELAVLPFIGEHGEEIPDAHSRL